VPLDGATSETFVGVGLPVLTPTQPVVSTPVLVAKQFWRVALVALATV
jgi:hypothetical protein